jgi:hypothetical protein
MTRDYSNEQIHTIQDNIRANLPPGAAGALLDILDKVKSGVPMSADQISAVIRLGEQQASQPGFDAKGGPQNGANGLIVGSIDQTANYLLGLQTARNILETSARAPETVSSTYNAGTMHVLTQIASDYSDPYGWEESWDDWNYDELDFSAYLDEQGWYGGDYLDGYGYELSSQDLDFLTGDMTPTEMFGLQGDENGVKGMMRDFGDSLDMDLGQLAINNGPQVQPAQADNEFEFGAQPSGVSGPTMKMGQV